MKNLSQIEKFLLPSVYRKRGFQMLFLGFPLAIFLLSVLVINWNSAQTEPYLDEWKGYLIHIPISLGLFWILFASEKEEDEIIAVADANKPLNTRQQKEESDMMKPAELRKELKSLTFVTLTPFDKDGNLDLEGYRENIRWICEKTNNVKLTFSKIHFGYIL